MNRQVMKPTRDEVKAAIAEARKFKEGETMACFQGLIRAAEAYIQIREEYIARKAEWAEDVKRFGELANKEAHEMAELKQRLLEFSEAPAGDLIATKQKLETANRTIDELEDVNTTLQFNNAKLREALESARRQLRNILDYDAILEHDRPKLEAEISEISSALSTTPSTTAGETIKLLVEAITKGLYAFTDEGADTTEAYDALKLALDAAKKEGWV